MGVLGQERYQGTMELVMRVMFLSPATTGAEKP